MISKDLSLKIKPGFNMKHILDNIHSPDDLQKLSLDELNVLCGEIRSQIIKTVSTNGGHLSSNLGAVELTVALRRVFPSIDDKIVWDVGHQSYTHKILTGRQDRLATIRKKGGLCGYPNREESPYDAFNAGHASTSISAALGIAQAKKLKGEAGNAVAVIGDGALTGGLAYEGLNNAGRFRGKLIVVLNDNTMSISRNVGSIARYLATIRTNPAYRKVKGDVESVLRKIPAVGEHLYRGASKAKSAFKHMIYNNTIFEDLGFLYFGPFDGHDLENLLDVFTNAKDIDRPVLIHLVTSKGKGYHFAEENPGRFHGISSFDIKTGSTSLQETNFSTVFGSTLCSIAAKDRRVCAITAAMQLGTSLSDFAIHYPDRFFDVGIAEEHAVTFASGLAVSGLIPVCAIYSTFLQRSYDQLIHDAALQNAHMVLAIDRGGVVGSDGETHQGVFDVAFLNTIPNTTIYAPSYYEELSADLALAVDASEGIVAVRYPRGSQLFKPFDFTCSGHPYDVYGLPNAAITIVTYGRLFSYACQALFSLREKGLAVSIIKLNRIKPIPEEALALAARAEKLFFFEEGVEQGGVGEHFITALQKGPHVPCCYLRGICGFVKHASMEESLRELALDPAGMENLIESECGKWQ